MYSKLYVFCLRTVARVAIEAANLQGDFVIKAVHRSPLETVYNGEASGDSRPRGVKTDLQDP